MKVNKTITHISPNENIDILDKNTEIYYDFRAQEDDTLEQSVAKDGILVPLHIVGTPKGPKTLVSGMRRLNAARAVGLETIPVIFHHPDEWPQDEADQHMLMIQYNKGRHKKPSELWQEGQVIRAYNKKHSIPGKSSELIAKELGHMSSKTYERLTAVMLTNDRDLIERMDLGELSISQAYNTIKEQPMTESHHVALADNPEPDTVDNSDPKPKPTPHPKLPLPETTPEPTDEQPKPSPEFKAFVKTIFDMLPTIQEDLAGQTLSDLVIKLKLAIKGYHSGQSKKVRDGNALDIVAICYLITLHD